MKVYARQMEGKEQRLWGLGGQWNGKITESVETKGKLEEGCY